MKQTALVASAISSILLIFVVTQHNLGLRNNSTIVLPAGGTYLGPSATATQAPVVQRSETVSGRIHPYTVTVPQTIAITTFPNDPFDIYALVIDGQPPENNVLIGVDDLTRSDALAVYVNGSKRSYVENWWKQFGGLKGVESISEFTNTSGLKGYKAKYMGGSSTDIFFETPDNRYVIHLANGPLSQAVFDAIVDSVAWKKQ